MANVIYNPATGLVHNPIVFGKENANDIIGLDPTYLILEKVFFTPEYDPETEQAIESWTIDTENLQYVQGWTIVAIVPEPKWESFNLGLLSDDDFDSASKDHQGIATSLMLALDNYRKGEVSIDGLATYCNLFCSVANPLPAVRETWATIAERNFMPKELIDVIRGQ